MSCRPGIRIRKEFLSEIARKKAGLKNELVGGAINRVELKLIVCYDIAG